MRVNGHSPELIKKVKEYYNENKGRKKYKHDATFSVKNVSDKFGLTTNQIKRILYTLKD